MQHDFAPGQRWLSEAEPDLGLGLVLAADARRVSVRFPAGGETRTYARQSAPLSRVRFSVAERIEDAHGACPMVEEVLESDGLINYRVRDADGGVRVLPESELNHRMRLGRPRDRLFAGRLDSDIWFDLRRCTWEAMGRAGRSEVFGLCGPRVSLIPHQLHIAAEVSGRHAPRVLLADEVGLGKTIEAGLILHRLLLTERAQRVLILVPGPLIHQWLVEMRRRFNLAFALFDAERIAAMGEGNPFQAEQLVLCSLEFLASSPLVARAALDGDWDLLVVDEAHHLHWDEQSSSLEYDLVQALAECTPGVLLLTATPEQLGRAGHFARLRLLDPERFYDYPAFLAEEQAYEPVGRLATSLLEGEDLSPEQERLKRELLGEEFESASPEAVLNVLLDRHGTGRVLFRNTRSAIQGFPGRDLQVHSLTWPGGYADTGDPRARLTPEAGVRGWADFDPRLPWLVRLLRELRPHKVLVICILAATARELAEGLLRGEGIHAALFHEGMSILDRDRAAAYFADPEQGSRVLICSEIGSEGRNFQFAHHLVLFDLPLDPDLLEQRLGRLDRIGQTDTIRLHVPVLEGGAGERLMRWYRDGLAAFQAPCPAAGSVYERLKPELLAMLAGEGDPDELIAQASELNRRLGVELENGRDRLLELHSHRPKRAEALAEAVRRMDGDAELEDYLFRYWDAFGVEHEPGSGHSIVLKPGRHMRQDSFPGLTPDGLTVSFERADALVHEDREFITWEHPMVVGAMDMLAMEELGVAAMTVAKHPDYRPGTPLLELLYVVECPAPRGLHIRQFLPPTVIRLLLNTEGRDLARELSPRDVRGRCLSREHKLAESLLKYMKGTLEHLLELGRGLAESAGGRMAGEALAAMEQGLIAELERLRYLIGINPNVRPDELEHMEARKAELTTYIKDARVRLDALRVIVMS